MKVVRRRQVNKVYRVTVREIWSQEHEVEAKSEKEAIKLVADGEGETVGNPEFCHTSEPSGGLQKISAWTAEVVVCGACEGHGYMHGFNEDTDTREIQRCDTCKKFRDDEAAIRYHELKIENGQHEGCPWLVKP